MRLRRLRSFASGGVCSTSVTLNRVVSHRQVLGADTPYPAGAPMSVRAWPGPARWYFFAATHVSAQHECSSPRNTREKALI